VSTSIGVVIATSAYADTAALLRDADTAMYRAKTAGRQTYKVFESEASTAAQSSATQEDELRAAIDAGKMETHFQPIVSLADGRVVGLEAFSRWRRGDALVPCSDFIAAAQQAGLVHRLTEQALRDACGRLEDWTGRGIIDVETQMCINVTERQLLQAGFPGRGQEILEESHTSAKRIRIDVSQHRSSPDATRTEEAVLALRQQGLCVDIDDFDGSSSVSVLRDTSVNAVKLDHSVIEDGQLNDTSVAFVDGLIRMAHLLGKKVIAERVETDLEVQTLRDLHCDFAQGHFFCRPLSATGTEQFLMGAGNPIGASRKEEPTLRES
jgi:EAL domain-containing protein (putative c-di-GMP-specific phosphodiesterase class I)